MVRGCVPFLILSEFQMAQMNRHLDSRIETIFLMPNEKYFYTSSQLIKQVHLYGNRETDLVPHNVLSVLRKINRQLDQRGKRGLMSESELPLKSKRKQLLA